MNNYYQEKEEIEWSLIKNKIEMVKFFFVDLNFTKTSIYESADQYIEHEGEIFLHSIKSIKNLYRSIRTLIIEIEITEEDNDYSELIENYFFNMQSSFAVCRYIIKGIYEICNKTDRITNTMKKRIRRKYETIGRSGKYKEMKEYRDKFLHEASFHTFVFENGVSTSDILKISDFMEMINGFLVGVINITNNRIGNFYYGKGVEKYEIFDPKDFFQ